MHLNRDRIVTSALTLLDAYGLGDVTMRRVATSLSVAPGALYWHFPNKQALLAALAQHIVAPAMESEAVTSPVALSLSLRKALLAHRDGAEVVSAAVAQPNSQVWADITTALSKALQAEIAHLDADEQMIGTLTLCHFVLGAVLAEQSESQLVELTRRTNSGRDAGLARTDGTTASARATDNDGAAVIERGAQVVIRGLRRKSA